MSPDIFMIWVPSRGIFVWAQVLAIGAYREAPPIPGSTDKGFATT